MKKVITSLCLLSALFLTSGVVFAADCNCGCASQKCNCSKNCDCGCQKLNATVKKNAIAQKIVIVKSKIAIVKLKNLEFSEK